MVGLHKSGGNAGSFEESIGSKLLGAALGLFVAAIAGTGFYFLYHQHQLKAEIDPVTFCPRSGPGSIKAVLIDRTDAITDLQRELLQSHVKKWASEVPQGGSFQVFEVGVGGDLLNPVVSVCNPGDGANASQLIANPGMLHKTYEKRFMQPINRMLDGMTADRTAPKSPIMEAVQAISVRDFGEDGPKGANSLIIVSDLLQNGTDLSFYKNVPDPIQFSKSAVGRSLHSDLSGVNASIYLIDRKKDSRFQTNEVGLFWLKWLADQGADVDGLSHIPG